MSGIPLPWFRSRRVECAWSYQFPPFGKDFWAYGIEPNRPTWEAIGRYVHEQGLAPRVVLPEELFPVPVE